MFYFLKTRKRCVILLLAFTALINTVYCSEQSVQQKNISCEKTQESEFPEDLFTKKQRKYGAIILHVIFFIYVIGAITLICEEYFLPTIQCICTDLKLSDDVAAATFMSLATSSPELFTSIIGTFITESDIGLGHVIGNGYFNLFFVAALGGLAAKNEIVLDWWPLTRDCSIYILITATLMGIVWDGTIQTYETIILLLLYIIYFFLMFNNTKIIEKISQKFNVSIIKTVESEPESSTNVESRETKILEKGEIKEKQPLDPNANSPIPLTSVTERVPHVENKYKAAIKKIYSLPLQTILRYTIPDVRKATRRKYYPITFLICVAWIGVTTYLATWMISVIGETLGIPDLIMGMVFLAAGGSVVEAYSVYYKSKRGECSIGLSNSIGCNNLDATLCLGLPWFIKTLLPIKNPECHGSSSKIVLESPFIRFNFLLLLVCVFILFGIFYANKFKLNRKLGFICTGVYVLVLTIAISMESYEEND